jgi:hypothetical protein
MGIYKKGYVCWSSDTFFNPQGKDEDEMFVRRREKVRNGMAVTLKPKTREFPTYKHAAFVYLHVDTQLSAPKPLFDKVTAEEREIYIKHIDEKRRKGKK